MSEPDPAPSPFDQLIGTNWGEMSPERATATLEIADHHRQPYGPVHGGVLCTLAEGTTSRATGLSVAADGNRALGQSNNLSFLRPMLEGTIHVEAHRRHGGRTSWVWDVEFTDDEGRLCALSRVIVAVRPPPQSR
ncbi:MAG: PaaI family thioesterase [Solirubrobacterales bacterium]